MAEISNIEKQIGEIEGKARVLSGYQLKFVALIAFSWSLFQLWYASPLPFLLGFGVLIDLPARSIHLGFALFLVFLAYPCFKKDREKKFNYFSFFLAFLGLLTTFYISFAYQGLVYRNGILLAPACAEWIGEEIN